VDLGMRKKRASEEQQISLHEMKQVHDHYCNLQSHVRSVLDADDLNNELTMGQHAVVLKRLVAIERKCLQLQLTFKAFITTDTVDTGVESDAGCEDETVDNLLISDIYGYHNDLDV
jgi:hypothetical protein